VEKKDEASEVDTAKMIELHKTRLEEFLTKQERDVRIKYDVLASQERERCRKELDNLAKQMTLELKKLGDDWEKQMAILCAQPSTSDKTKPATKSWFS
jgi:hypothetical protein